MNNTFTDFYDYMVKECGMDGDWNQKWAICCECGEPIHEKDYNGDFNACPVCEFELDGGN